MKVFQVSECDWMMAESPEQAREVYMQTIGDTDGEWVWELDEVIELSAEDMQKLMVHDEDENTHRRFATELDRLMSDPKTAIPQIFASTEY